MLIAYKHIFKKKCKCKCGCGNLKKQCIYKGLEHKENHYNFNRLSSMKKFFSKNLMLNYHDVDKILQYISAKILVEIRYFEQLGIMEKFEYITSKEIIQLLGLHYYEIKKIVKITNYINKQGNEKILSFVVALNIVFSVFIFEANFVDLNTTAFYKSCCNKKVSILENKISIREYNKIFINYSIEEEIRKILYN